MLEPSRGVFAAPAVRRDHVEPAEACRRAARSRRSRLACRAALSRHCRTVRPGARTPEARRPPLRDGLVGLGPDLVRDLDRPRRVLRTPCPRALDLHRVADHLRAALALRAGPPA